MAADLLTGLGSSIKRLFSPRGKDELADKTTRLKPDSSLSPESTKRIKNLVQKYYQQGSYEKAPFNRKWARNTLLFQGYHDLEWSQTQHAWEATDDYNEFAYPNNLYRAKILDAVNLYTKHAPEFRFTPTADDLESQAIAIAAQNALEVVKKNVQYDRLRAIEAEHLHLYGNSFRYSYYSVDPRFGTAGS